MTRTVRRIQVATLCLFTLAVARGEALAQAQRGGFTFLVDLGVGVQNDRGLDESATGLAGLNLGGRRFSEGSPRLDVPAFWHECPLRLYARRAESSIGSCRCCPAILDV